MHHIAQDAGAVVVAAASPDIDFFADIELNVINKILVPQRLEHAVGKTEGKQVLHGLFAEVMINPIDLVFVPMCENGLV